MLWEVLPRVGVGALGGSKLLEIAEISFALLQRGRQGARPAAGSSPRNVLQCAVLLIGCHCRDATYRQSPVPALPG